MHNESIHELSSTCLQLLISHSQKPNRQTFALHSYYATWSNLDFRYMKTFKPHIQLSSEHTCFISPRRRVTPSAPCISLDLLSVVHYKNDTGTPGHKDTQICPLCFYFLYCYKGNFKIQFVNQLVVL